jgi:AcrR family transcriptional regulator
MTHSEWMQVHTHVLQLEQEGIVTRTFRRLDPERQQAILMAILEEAAEKGPAALNIKLVAERAGVSVGSLYTYFPNRDGMLAFAAQVCVAFIRDSFNEFRPYLTAVPIREGLTGYLVGGVEWSTMYKGMLQFFARAAYHGDPELADSLVRPVSGLMCDLVREMLEKAVERGEVRPDIDLEATTRVVHALTLALGDAQLLPHLNVYFQVSDNDLPAERTLEAMVALLLDGMGTDMGAGGGPAGTGPAPEDGGSSVKRQ